MITQSHDGHSIKFGKYTTSGRYQQRRIIMKYSLAASGPVRPADCTFSLFRSTYLAASAWNVVENGGDSSTSQSIHVVATAGRCEPSMRASQNQQAHIRSIDKLNIQQLAREGEEEAGPKEELQVGAVCGIQAARSPARTNRHAERSLSFSKSTARVCTRASTWGAMPLLETGTCCKSTA